MANTYVVTAPLVVCKVADGTDRYVYQDSPLPEGVAADTVAQLLKSKMVAEVDAAEVDPDKKPAQSASRGDWEAYAVAHGMSEEEAEAFSNKDELIAAVG